MARQQIQTTTSPSEIYEQYMVPAVFSRWAAALLDSVSPQPGERVLDLACGTGVVARMAAPMVQPGGEISGLDFNGAQITTARTMDPSIDWQKGDAAELPFADEEFDLVVCQQGFQFFPDRVQAVKEVRRVLKPGGRVAITSWSSIGGSPGYLAIANALGKTVSASAAGLLDELFAFTTPEEVGRFFAEGGFPDAKVTTPRIDAVFASAEELTRAIAVGSIMRRTQTQFSDETLDLMAAEVAAEMAPYLGDDGLVFPMEAQMLTAKK